jgi:hypothetical protein
MFRARDSQRPLWGRAQWVVLPMLVVGLSESVVRETSDRLPRWYAAAEELAEQGRIDAIFIGSSQTQAAITTTAFSEAVALRTGRRPRVLNLGRGYSSIVEHYLGLRNVIASSRRRLEDVTVFVEAPEGVAYSDRWDGPWTNTEQFQLIVDLLRFSDLPALWRSGGQSYALKLGISARLASRRCALVNRRERFRELLFGHLLSAVAIGGAAGSASVESLGDDLQGPGQASGIRTDEAVVREAREGAQRWADEFAQSAVPMQDWRGTVLEDLVRLLRQVNGHVVFVSPPESEVMRRAFRSPVLQQNARAFAAEIRRWDSCYLRPAFNYTDEDLPDLWHLRPERSPEFSRLLADAWLTTCAVSGRMDDPAANSQ